MQQQITPKGDLSNNRASSLPAELNQARPDSGVAGHKRAHEASSSRNPRSGAGLLMHSDGDTQLCT